MYWFQPLTFIFFTKTTLFWFFFKKNWLGRPDQNSKSVSQIGSDLKTMFSFKKTKITVIYFYFWGFHKLWKQADYEIQPHVICFLSVYVKFDDTVFLDWGRWWWLPHHMILEESGCFLLGSLSPNLSF
jgi:hypothetical protein